MKNNTLVTLTLFSATLLMMVWGGVASAQGISKGTRPIGMGSAVTANANGNGAIYHNPAGMSSILMLAGEGSYSQEKDFQAYNVSIIDSKLNTRMAAALAYSYETSTKDDNKLTGHDARVAFSSRVHRNLVVGIGGRYLDYSDGDNDLFSGYTMDLGVIYKITNGLFVGVAGNNLLNLCEGSDDMACPSTVAPRVARGGLSFGSSLGFQISADVMADFSSVPDERLMTWATGTELLIANLVSIRGGYQYLQTPKEHVITFGGGLKSLTAGIDLGYTHNLKTKENLFSMAIQFYP